MALKKLENEQGYLKAGFLGYQKSGKSYTAVLLAIGVRKFFGLQGPIAFFDTESGSGYVASMVREATGTDLLGVRARSFAELMQFTKDCMEAKVSVAIVDSVTHPWRELTDSYLVQVNAKRAERNLYPLQKLEFQHWAAIKAIWQPWSDFYLNSPLHLIVCGRAGAIWEMEKNEETNRRELVQAGTKMKVEGEFGFEPSLLIEMEREQQPDGKGGFKMLHTATVLGDRFNVIDGKTMVNPTFEFFKPHVEKLKPGAHAPVNVESRTQTGADLEGFGDWDREKRKRTILCEEIQGAIVAKYPGQSAEDKKAKADLMGRIFNTRSWTRIESMDSQSLEQGLQRLRVELGELPATPIDEQDDLPMGPTPLQGTPLPPNGSKPAGDPAAKQQSATLEVVRALMKAQKVDEGRFLQMMTELGHLPGDAKSLEEAETMEPGCLESALANWVGFMSVYKETTK